MNRRGFLGGILALVGITAATVKMARAEQCLTYTGTFTPDPSKSQMAFTQNHIWVMAKDGSWRRWQPNETQKRFAERYAFKF